MTIFDNQKRTHFLFEKLISFTVAKSPEKIALPLLNINEKIVTIIKKGIAIFKTLTQKPGCCIFCKKVILF